MSLFERGRPAVHVPTAAREVFDVTGAGDTVIATLALALCAGAALDEAAILANRGRRRGRGKARDGRRSHPTRSSRRSATTAGA